MENNTNVNQSEKKHNKLVSWFLGLPKWGKILLVGGSVAGVATAVTVPTVLALTKEDAGTKIDYAQADAWGSSHLNYRSFIENETDSSTYSRFDDYNNIADSFKSGDMNWNSSNEAGTSFIIENFDKLLERSKNPEYLTNCPLKGSSALIAEKIREDNKITSSAKGQLANDYGQFMFIPKKEAKGEEGVTQYEDFINEEYEFVIYNCEYYKLNNDGFRIRIDFSKQIEITGGQGTGYANLDFNNKGILFKMKMDVAANSTGIGEIKMTFEVNLNFSI